MTRTLVSTRLVSFGMPLVAVGVVGQLTTTASAALLVYDPFSHDGAPTSYLLGDESSGINVIGGQNPVVQPTDRKSVV